MQRTSTEKIKQTGEHAKSKISELEEKQVARTLSREEAIILPSMKTGYNIHAKLYPDNQPRVSNQPQPIQNPIPPAPVPVATAQDQAQSVPPQRSFFGRLFSTETVAHTQEASIHVNDAASGYHHEAKKLADQEKAQYDLLNCFGVCDAIRNCICPETENKDMVNERTPLTPT